MLSIPTLKSRPSNSPAMHRTGTGWGFPVLSYVLGISLVVSCLLLGRSGTVRADAATPTPESCDGLSMVGFWDIGYMGTTVGTCRESLQQYGCAFSGTISCTHDPAGTISAGLYVHQGVLKTTDGTIQFEQPPATVSFATTYSSDGNSSNSVWMCAQNCEGPHSAPVSGVPTVCRLASVTEVRLPLAS